MAARNRGALYGTGYGHGKASQGERATMGVLDDNEKGGDRNNCTWRYRWIRSQVQGGMTDGFRAGGLRTILGRVTTAVKFIRVDSFSIPVE